MKGDVYHILNRGVEKRKIFFDENDRFRFIHNLYDFNDINYAPPYRQRCRARAEKDKHELVDLLCWAAPLNHSHNLVQEKIEGGASIFSKKIFGGYTKYINEKYDRNGVLFQGRSKIIKVQREPHFFYLPFYITANLIDLIEPGWKKKGIKNIKKVMDFLENCRWSSFPDLIGKENFPLLINKNLFYEIFGTNEKKFKNDFIEWLKG
jgi:putative transposase